MSEHTDTIGRWIEAHGGNGRVDLGGFVDSAILDRAVTAQLSTWDDASLHVHCGGEAVITFVGTRFGRNSTIAHIVRDDAAGETWDFARREHHAGSPASTVAELGPRPFPKLRLAVPA